MLLADLKKLEPSIVAQLGPCEGAMIEPADVMEVDTSTPETATSKLVESTFVHCSVMFMFVSTAAAMTTQPLVKKEPLGEDLTSTTTSMCIGKVLAACQ